MIFQSPRLTLVPARKDNLEALRPLVTDPFIRKHLFDDIVLSSEEIKGILAESVKLFETVTYGLWLVCENKSDKIIGFAGFWHFFNEQQPQLLYALLEEYTGNGYATEVCHELIIYAFDQLGFNNVVASCDKPNVNSQRVAEAVGMIKIREEIINEKPVVFYQIDNPMK